MKLTFVKFITLMSFYNQDVSVLVEQVSTKSKSTANDFFYNVLHIYTYNATLTNPHKPHRKGKVHNAF